MLNKNGKILLYPTTTRQGTIKAVDGNTTNVNIPSYARGIILAANSKLILGSGEDDPTVDDYCIQTEVSDLEVISNTIPNRDLSSALGYDSNYILSATITVKNNTSNSITIKEVAYYGYWDGSAWGNNKYYMLAREIITPVTIEPQKTYTFSMTIG